MRGYTKIGYLKHTIRELSGSNTLSIRELSLSFTANPRLVFYTAYYAYLCNIRTNDEQTLTEIRKIEDGKRSWEISKFENSYRRERDRSKITADIKELYRQKISEIIGNDGRSAYQICKELHIDQSNFSKFLKGDVSRISLNTVRAVHETYC